MKNLISKLPVSRTRYDNFQEDVERFVYKFKQNRMSLLGLAIILFLILSAVLAPFIAPYPADAGYKGQSAVHFDRKFIAPSLSHPFGTDEVGRDILSRVIFGTRISLGAGFLVVLLAALIGVPLGITAAYIGGPFGSLIMRVTDVFLSLPPLLLALTVTVALEPNLTNSILAVGVVWWPWYTRVLYGETLSVKEETFVEASRGIGSSTPRIIFKEILPNVIAPITVRFSLDMGLAILVIAGLGFLGLGTQPPTPEWGTLISQGRDYLPARWWYSTFPGLAIFVAVMGFNFLGDGIRDMFDVEEQYYE